MCRNLEKSFPELNISRDFYKLIWEINSILLDCKSSPHLNCVVIYTFKAIVFGYVRVHVLYKHNRVCTKELSL